MQPFEKHPADVGALRQTGSELLSRSAEAINNGKATRTAYQPAIDHWRGMGAPEMAAAAEPVQRNAETAQHALAWAAATIQYWGTQVEGFNRQVDTITGGLAARAGNDYGATGTDGKPPTDAQIADAKAGATAVARQQWQQAYHTYIDTGRHEVASMLQRGPTEQNLLKLREAGVLPGHGFNPFPDMWDATKDLVDPAAYLGSLGYPALGTNLGLLGIGGSAAWATYGKYGMFKPHGINANGHKGFISPKDAPFYKRFQSKHWKARPYKAATRNKWMRVGRYGGYAGGVLSGATSAYDQWTRDSGRTDLNTSETTGRAFARGAIVGGGAWGGAAAGASIGGAVGGPVGAVVGGVVGGVVGSGVANEAADHVVDWAGDRAEDVTSVAKDAYNAVNPFD